MQSVIVPPGCIKNLCAAGDRGHVSIQLDSEAADGTVRSAHRLFEAPGGSVLSMGDIEARPLSSKAAAPTAARAKPIPSTSTRQVRPHQSHFSLRRQRLHYLEP